MSTARPKVLIATPSQDLSVHADYMHSVLRLLATDAAEWLVAPSAFDGDIVRVRSRYVPLFLKTDCTHLLFIDADLDFHPLVIEGMVREAEKGKDFVSCRYRRKSETFSEVVGGVGLALLSRAMLVQMTERFRDELWFTDEDGREVVALFALSFSPVAPGEPPKRRLLSEDFAFRERWRSMGGEVVDVQAAPGAVGHHGSYRFSGAPQGGA